MNHASPMSYPSPAPPIFGTGVWLRSKVWNKCTSRWGPKLMWSSSLDEEICRDHWGRQGMAAMRALLCVWNSLFYLSIEYVTHLQWSVIKLAIPISCTIQTYFTVQTVNSIVLVSNQAPMTTKSPIPVLVPHKSPVLGHPMEILQGQATRASGIKV